MAERLTDDHLAAWAAFDGEGIIDFSEVQAMVAELQERRAADHAVEILCEHAEDCRMAIADDVQAAKTARAAAGGA